MKKKYKRTITQGMPKRADTCVSVRQLPEKYAIIAYKIIFGDHVI